VLRVLVPRTGVSSTCSKLVDQGVMVPLESALHFHLTKCQDPGSKPIDLNVTASQYAVTIDYHGTRACAPAEVRHANLRVDVDSDQVHVLGEFCIISGVDGKVVNLVGVCKSKIPIWMPLTLCCHAAHPCYGVAVHTTIDGPVMLQLIPSRRVLVARLIDVAAPR